MNDTNMDNTSPENISKDDRPDKPITLFLPQHLLEDVETLRRSTTGKIPSRHSIVKELLQEAVAMRLKQVA